MSAKKTNAVETVVLGAEHSPAMVVGFLGTGATDVETAVSHLCATPYDLGDLADVCTCDALLPHYRKILTAQQGLLAKLAAKSGSGKGRGASLNDTGRVACTGHAKLSTQNAFALAQLVGILANAADAVETAKRAAQSARGAGVTACKTVDRETGRTSKAGNAIVDTAEFFGELRVGSKKQAPIACKAFDALCESEETLVALRKVSDAVQGFIG